MIRRHATRAPHVEVEGDNMADVEKAVTALEPLLNPEGEEFNTLRLGSIREVILCTVSESIVTNAAATSVIRASTHAAPVELD